MMKVWNVTLIIMTFFLTIFGTFMTRSGIVQSVHAFGEDKQLAWIFTIFMAITLIVSFGFVIKRLPELRARATFESWLSREAAFTINNWVLLFAAFFVLFATMFPTISEKFTGERITVGPPFFNKWMVPIGLILLFLTGVGPLIAWRKASPSHLRYQFGIPSAAAILAIAICFALGIQTSPAAVICFALCAFVVGTISQEFARGIVIRKKNTGTDAVSALLGMVIRGRRRYGGYVVHVGIVLMFVGFAGTAYQKESEIHVEPGTEAKVGKYTIRFERLAHEEDRQKEMVTGEVTALVGGKSLRPPAAREVVLPQSRERADHRGGDPPLAGRGPVRHAGRLRSRRGQRDAQGGREPGRRLDLVRFHAAGDRDGDRAHPRLGARPLDHARPGADKGRGDRRERQQHRGADHLAGGRRDRGWAGPGPGRARGPRAGAGGGRRAHAADGDHRPQPPSPTGADENWLVRNIICQCGSCRHNLLECESDGCAYGARERVEVHNLLAQGKTRDEVIQYYITKYGSQIALASPIDKGFNRLAWLLPYGLAGVAAGLLGYGAYRLSRRPAPLAPAGPPLAVNDPDLQDKLEDELRNLD